MLNYRRLSIFALVLVTLLLGLFLSTPKAFAQGGSGNSSKNSESETQAFATPRPAPTNELGSAVARSGKIDPTTNATTPYGVYTCDWISCSHYLKRSVTRTIADKVARYQNASTATIAGAFAVACAPIGGVGAVVCGSVGAIYGGYAIDQFLAARSRNACIRLRQILIGPPIIYIYVDNGANCKN